MNLIDVDGRTFVAGQLRPEDVTSLQQAGVTLVINNRPDFEEPGQPLAAEVEAAARDAGLDYLFLPVAGGLAPDQVEAMAQALGQAEGRVLAFCRSGTRSIYLWALAEARNGAEGERLAAQAAAAGYDLSPLLPHLRR